MEYIFKNNLPLVNQWTQDIWTKFCAWLMDESEPGAIVLEEGGKPTKDDSAKPMELLTVVRDMSPEPPSNTAALREAMVKIKNLADDYEQCGTAKGGTLNNIYDIACATLAEPPRNCDVGTPKEQRVRFVTWCENHNLECEDCPLRAFRDSGDCGFAWIQMPYEEKEKTNEQ